MNEEPDKNQKLSEEEEKSSLEVIEEKSEAPEN